MKKYYFSLTSDGMLSRFTDQSKEKAEATMDIKESSILVGREASILLDRPYLETWMNDELLMCIPFNDKSNWFVNHNFLVKISRIIN
jgi:hypothetical protein